MFTSKNLTTLKVNMTYLELKDRYTKRHVVLLSSNEDVATVIVRRIKKQTGLRNSNILVVSEAKGKYVAIY